MTVRELQSFIESNLKEQEDPEACRDYRLTINVLRQEGKDKLLFVVKHKAKTIYIY